MDSQVFLQRPLARDGESVGAHSQTSDLRTNRGSRRRTYFRVAGGNRWRTQLGLSIHLDPRRFIHGLRLDASRLYRGSGGVHELDGGSLSRLQLGWLFTDHVRPGWAARVYRRNGAGVGRLRRLLRGWG